MKIEQSRANLQLLSTILRQNFGEDLLSKILAEDVRNADVQLIITEGIRRPSDIVYLKDVPGFKIIAVKTDARIRFERLTQRSENVDDKNKTWEQFQQDEQQEADRQIRDVMEKADFSLDNGGSAEDLYAQIDTLMTKLQ
jgi:dephospho-CoA kinase